MVLAGLLVSMFSGPPTETASIKQIWSQLVLMIHCRLQHETNWNQLKAEKTGIKHEFDTRVRSSTASDQHESNSSWWWNLTEVCKVVLLPPGGADINNLFTLHIMFWFYVFTTLFSMSHVLCGRKTLLQVRPLTFKGNFVKIAVGQYLPEHFSFTITIWNLKIMYNGK